MKNVGIILGGGIGQRMGYDYPKQYIKMGDKELISFSIEEFKKSQTLDHFVVVADSEEHSEYITKKYDVNVTLGGKTRNESMCNALDYIEELGGCTNIFVNEAARPMITSGLIDKFMGMMDDNIACIYCVKPITDSLETIDGHYADRTCYRLVMSPEAYSFNILRKYFKKDSPTTFPGHVIPDTYKKIQYSEYKENIKVTYPLDLVILEAYLNERERVSNAPHNS